MSFAPTLRIRTLPILLLSLAISSGGSAETAAPAPPGTSTGTVEGVVLRHLCCGDANSVAILSSLGLSAAAGVPSGLAGVTVSIGGKTAKTDAQGRFVVGGVAPGTYSATLTHPVYQQKDVWAPKLPAPVMVRAGQTSRQDFAMFPPYGVLKGRLIDAVSDKPIVDPLANGLPKPAYVYVPDNAGVHGDVFDVVEGAARTYNIAVLAGSRDVKVKAPGYAPLTTRVTLTAGQTSSVDLRLQPLAATLRGVVRDAVTAQPIAGATVVVGTKKLVTNTKGEYQATAVPPHQTLAVGSSKTGYQDSSAETLVAPGQVREKDLVVLGIADVAWQDLHGTVKDKATGKPLAGVAVEIDGRRVCTDASGQYQLRVGPSKPDLADQVSLLFIKKAYKAESRSVELRHAASENANGYTDVNRHDAALTPDAANKQYAGGCVPTIAVQDTAGAYSQQQIITVTDAATGKPVPMVAITGMQVTNRAQPFRVCTNGQGVAVLKDVSMAVGAASGQLIQKLTLHRNGYSPRVEPEHYTTFGRRNVIFTLTPNASSQGLQDCSGPG